MDKRFEFGYEHYDSVEQLPEQDKILVEKAGEALERAYAPYSHFRVGAAARLESGRIIIGNNQESEVFPAGMCAERNLLFHHQGTRPDDRIVSMAVVSDPGERECYPCGICRQVLADVRKRQNAPIRLIMASDASATVVPDVTLLLPFQFQL